MLKFRPSREAPLATHLPELASLAPPTRDCATFDRTPIVDARLRPLGMNATVVALEGYAPRAADATCW
jgi:hypothetical protein